MKPEEAEAIKDIRRAFSKRPRAEKGYSFEQWIKLQTLRVEREEERIQKNKAIEQRRRWEESNSNWKVKVGDPVSFEVNTSSGKVSMKGIARKQAKDGTWTISTALGEFKSYWVRKRHVADLSHIEIPESVKEIPTKKLLHMYKTARFNFYYDCCALVNGEKIQDTVLKAELANREHIPTKRQHKLLRQRKLLKK